MGKPTAPVIGKPFENLVKIYTQMAGMPYHRVTFIPHPVSRVPALQCREYIEGNDPITGRPIIEEIVDALTQPLTTEEKQTGIEERPVARLIGPDTEENLNQYFVENEMTDYLPIVLPTEERVAAMLKGTSHKADEVVGDIRGYEAMSFTVEKVAANAVMAGAKPEYMPVILAMAASGMACISSSTTSFSTGIVVNGPIRNEIGMNYGIGALSPFNQANAVIGRLGTLLSRSAGLGQPGKTFWGTQGNNFNYNHSTFAENEEALPKGWEPFHVQNGFKPEESAISFFHGWGLWHWNNTYKFDKNQAILQMASWILPTAWVGGFCLLLDPIVARDLVREGFPTKESLSEYVYKNSLLTLEEFWQYQMNDSFPRFAERGIEPYATWYKEPKGTLITRYREPEGIRVVVVGGETNDFWQGGDWRFLGSFAIDEWR